MPEAQIRELLNLIKDSYWKTFHFNYLEVRDLLRKSLVKNFLLKIIPTSL